MKASIPALCATLMLAPLVLSGCGATPSAAVKPSVPKTHHKVAPPKVSPAPSPDTKPTSGNELGVVPILEYHTLGSTEGRWQRTPQGLTADLTWLYDHNFVLVTMKQYESGDMNIPAGKHPAVLTFDDGDYSQFQWTSTHVPTPTSSVGVLEAFQAAHPDFHITATFFLNANPFGSDSVAKMQWLVAHGFELGNHTYTHANLNSLSPQGIEREVGEEETYIEHAVPGYVPVSFALPYGGLPQNAADRAAVLHGSYQGTSWQFLGVALVGANPAASPFSRQFSISVPRIQVCDPSLVAPSTRNYIFSGFEALFAKDPAMLYTSSGNAKWISFPAALAGWLNPAYSARADALAAPAPAKAAN